MTGDSPARHTAFGIVVTLVGAAHFVAPRLFDPVNRLGFPDRTPTFTHVNGAVETVIGLLSLSPRTRRLRSVVAVCHIAHLASGVIRTSRHTTRESQNRMPQN